MSVSVYPPPILFFSPLCYITHTHTHTQNKPSPAFRPLLDAILATARQEGGEDVGVGVGVSVSVNIAALMEVLKHFTTWEFVEEKVCVCVCVCVFCVCP
jgi:hypothetical protein